MQQGSRYILTIGAGIGCTGILYFLSLVLHLPFIATVPLVATTIYLLAKWMNPKQLVQGAIEKPVGKFPVILLAISMFLLTNKAYYIATQYGQWDAWAIWNLHATYLAHPQYWKNLFLNTSFAHPDYPLLLPAVIAFLNRLLLQTQNVLVSYGFHFLITLLIPVIIYLETFRKSIFIAGLTLILFATNEFYIEQGLAQMADTLLAFFLLCALVSIDHHKEDKHMLLLSAAFLGLCMWTKNEGLIIAVIFAAFHFKELFGTGRLRFSLIGFALPFTTWLLFKLSYAPTNDVVAGQGQETLQRLVQPQRYQLIYDYFVKNMHQYFRDAKYGVAIYLLICTIRRRMPDKRLLMLLTILLAYMAIYVVSPRELEWHLFTSQLRLMHQLMPAIMYVLASRFAGSGDGTNAGFQARFVSMRQRLQ
jgi:hypothetical protein